ncbi:MAG: hypothetical protein KDM91_21505, partial [Verrucomicrobiae bacterium]|nr:hypothetical protein [Verrucomicrobiae bacterium]
MTRWTFDEATGLLSRKEYADGQGTDYTYTESGQHRERLWARPRGDTGIPAGDDPNPGRRTAVSAQESKAFPPDSAKNRLATTYTYDEKTNALIEIAYPATENRKTESRVTYAHDRDGRVKTVTDATGSRAFDYDAQGRVLAEHVTVHTTAGPVKYTLHRSWTSLGQPESVRLEGEKNAGAPSPEIAHEVAYTWDSLGRLASVTSLAGT